MFSYKFYINTKKGNSLRLRIVNNRQKAEISMGLRWSVEDFEDTMSVNPTKRNLPKKRWLALRTSWLDDLKMQLADEGRSNCDVKVLKLLIADKFSLSPQVEESSTPTATQEASFLTHYRNYSSRHTNKRTQQIYQATLSRLNAFANSDKGVKPVAEMTFEDVTVEWLHRFDTFLSLTSPKKNARNIHFRNIRAVIRDAFKADLTLAHPFDRFSIKPEPTRKRALSIDALRALFNAEVEPWQQKYIDFLRLSFLLMGINVIDLCHADELTDGRLEYTRAKTHKLLSIKVEPEAMQIIERYKGNKHLLSFAEGCANYRHFYNSLSLALKRIKAQLGLKELTTYWIRHSWATVAASLDIPKETIAHALSHGNNSVTDIYIDFDIKKVDAANRKVIDWVLYGKQ